MVTRSPAIGHAPYNTVMPQLTGGQALVALLRRHGVDTLFALPGYQNDQLFNALYDASNTRDAIRVIHTRHEQGAAYMAYGYAKSSGRVGAYAVVPGPGMLNTTAALSTAYAASTPVLCITGQIPTHTIGKGYGMLHEIPDSLAVLRSLTKWAERVPSTRALPALVDEAFRQLHTGRPRPVALEVPMDVLAEAADITLREAPPQYAVQKPDEALIREAARLLASAQNPLIMIGGGCEDSGSELLALAETLQAPVVSTSSGRGVLSDRHYLSLSGPGGHALWAQADVVLAIGTRLQSAQLNWGLDDVLKLIRVDIDHEEIFRVKAPTLAIEADAGATVRALIAALPTDLTPRASRRQEMLALKELLDERYANVKPQYDYLSAIRSALPDDGIFVEDLTQVGYSSRYILPSYHARAHIHSNYQGTLGYGFAAALGAKIANPERAVVCVNGDGGFMYNVQELATAAQHQIGVVVVVFEDGAFGNVQRMQREDHGGRVIATELKNPDFVALAHAYGVNALRAQDPHALGEAIQTALRHAGPTLIHVPVGRMSSPWEFVVLPKVRGAIDPKLID
jgi:acetolactate synthase-1/2/3 large subunit